MDECRVTGRSREEERKGVEVLKKKECSVDTHQLWGCHQQRDPTTVGEVQPRPSAYSHTLTKCMDGEHEAKGGRYSPPP
jgi:hypothetical protein